MSDFVKRLAELDPEAQKRFAYDNAPRVSTAELIEALQDVELEGWPELHVSGEIIQRGPGSLEDVIRATLRVDPLSAASRRFAEVLEQFYMYEETTRPRVVEALIALANAALDAGGGSMTARSPIVHLMYCARIEGPLLDAVPVARRMLEVAAREPDPSLFVVSSARELCECRRSTPEQ